MEPWLCVTVPHSFIAIKMRTPEEVALRDWLNLLRNTLPASWSSVHELVNELLDNISYAVRTEEYLVAVLDDYLQD